jgi:heme-degrading monooxygenase HmoA
MSERCLELVVYTVRDADDATRIRREAMDHIKTMPGFISWTAVRGCEDDATFADLAEWQSLAHAQAAAETFVKDARFADFRAAISGMIHMSHFTTDASVAV